MLLERRLEVPAVAAMGTLSVVMRVVTWVVTGVVTWVVTRVVTRAVGTPTRGHEVQALVAVFER